MPNINLSILNQKATPSFYADTLANRPAPSFVGRVFISTDTYDLYRDTGTAWDLLSPSAAAGVTGTGVSGQLALWNGTTSITGDTGLLYNATDNSLTADKFVKAGGTSAQILAADGSNITAGTGISISGGTISTSGGSGVSGSGAANQVAFWNGTTAITGENNLYWDSTNNHLGINTTTPGTSLDIHDTAETLIQLNQTSSFNSTRIAFQSLGDTKWRIGNEGGTNNFYIEEAINSLIPFYIDNTNIKTYIGGDVFSGGSGTLIVSSPNSDNHLQIVGTLAPSIRISDFATGASTQCGIGQSTGANNFIQGSTLGDMCIFNSSLTAYPILFGIYNGTNIQEACRISTSRNFIVGKTTDTGQKLQISGTALITGAATFSSTGTFTGIVTSNSYFAVGTTSSSYNVQGTLGYNSTRGIVLTGKTATTYDLALYSASGGALLVNPTGTGTLQFLGGQNFIVGSGTDNGAKCQIKGGLRVTNDVSFDNGLTGSYFSLYGDTDIYITNSAVGDIASINNTTGVYTPLSDINKKKNFEISNLGLDAILKLKPTLYNMKNQNDNESKELGFIAQEVKDIISQAYVENKNFIGLNYNAIVTTLVKAVQELNHKIENLK